MSQKQTATPATPVSRKLPLDLPVRVPLKVNTLYKVKFISIRRISDSNGEVQPMITLNFLVDGHNTVAFNQFFFKDKARGIQNLSFWITRLIPEAPIADVNYLVEIEGWDREEARTAVLDSLLTQIETLVGTEAELFFQQSHYTKLGRQIPVVQWLPYNPNAEETPKESAETPEFE